MEWAKPLVKEAMVQGDELNYAERRDFMRIHRLGGKACPRCGARISEITAGQDYSVNLLRSGHTECIDDILSGLVL